MTTPFDEFINDIKKKRYHNHRLESHSDIVSEVSLKISQIPATASRKISTPEKSAVGRT
jgi:hypothetical protein